MDKLTLQYVLSNFSFDYAEALNYLNSRYPEFYLDPKQNHIPKQSKPKILPQNERKIIVKKERAELLRPNPPMQVENSGT